MGDPMSLHAELEALRDEASGEARSTSNTAVANVLGQVAADLTDLLARHPLPPEGDGEEIVLRGQRWQVVHMDWPLASEAYLLADRLAAALLAEATEEGE